MNMYYNGGKPKYHNKKITIDGQTFDSLHEYHRYADLRLMERAGVIWDLKRQVHFNLIPKQIDANGNVVRKVDYIADFVYIKDGKQIVEDAKSPATAKDKTYILKKKLMLREHGITVTEVYANDNTNWIKDN